MNLKRYLLSLAATLIAGSSLAAEPSLTFVLHNLHLDHFDAGGFHAPATTHAVHKDQRGRIWIGTQAGLYLYDGNQVREFRHDPASRKGLPNSFVKEIDESSDGTIWVGTWGGGLAYFDEDTRSFQSAEILPQYLSKPGPEFDGRVWSMAIDEWGDIWIGTFTSGLFRYDPRSHELHRAFFVPVGKDMRGNRIDAVTVDSNGQVWFTPYRNGFRVIDRDTFEPALNLPPSFAEGNISDIDKLPNERILLTYWNSIQVLDNNGVSLLELEVTPHTSNESIMAAVSYSEDQVLLGTAGGRLWNIDLAAKRSFPIPTGKHPGAMEPSIVWDMFLAPDGDLLIGGTTGLWIAPAISRQFWTIAGFDKTAPLFFTETRAILFNENDLFLNDGTQIYRIDFDGKLDRPRVLAGEKFVHTSGYRPLWMERGPNEWLWIGADHKVFYVDKSGQARIAQGTDGGAQTILRDAHTGRLYVDRKQELLELTPRLFEAMPGDGEALVNEADNGQLSANHLHRGSYDDVWAGTFSGIERLSISTGRPLPVFSPNAMIGDWKDPYTTFFHAVSENEMLIGSFEGIWRALLNGQGEIRKLERILDGEPFVLSAFDAVIRTTDRGLLFFGEPGLVRYDRSSGTTESLSVDEGLPSYETYSAGYHQWGDLAILSGQTGPLLFHPDGLALETPTREVVLTDITSFRNNGTVAWPRKPEDLKFQYEDRVIRFKFGLLDYLNPMNDRYAIRLAGFQNDWLEIGGLKEFSFTNLDPGKYRLDIKVTEGLTGKHASTSVPFEVLPPWWQTWWAYTLYAFAFLGSLFWYWWSLQRKLERERDVSQRLREADRIKSHFLNELEDKVEDATRDLRHAVEALEIKNVELDAAQHRALDASRLKSEFLANMSHEIRTPMNGVLGFTQLLRKSKLDNDQQDYVETIEKSARSLLGIINDVLDVSKIEAGKLMIDSTGFDVRACISDTLEALAPVAYEKNLELVGHYEEDLPDGLRGDPTRIRQMITNLVGNAIKFTDAGTVLVHLEAHSDDDAREWLRIRVSDTGRGISAEDRERLFQAFERGSISLTSRYTGTGLGLVITKKLCEAMGGRIELDSAPGHGTRVILDLPLVADRNPENTYGSGKPLSGRSVLLVDSHAHSRDAARSRLVYWGADVTAVASLVTPVTGTFDIAVIGVERKRLGDMLWLQSQIGHLPAELPHLCLVASVDRDALRTLSESSRATCVSKIGHLQGQLRRIMEPIGIAAETTRVNIDVDATCRLDELHVVVADDNRINRYFIKKILELHGARVTEADSGTAVLRRLGELASNDNVDIVLLDVHMPDVDGLEVARRIRAGGEHRLPLLAVSANVQPETYEAAIAAGINDYLLKPIEESKLVEAVLEWTGREKEVTSDE